MNQSQSTQKLLILFFLVFGLAYSQECSPLNPELYGDCTIPLGYVWTGSNCVLVYGCETGEDEEYFFDTYPHIYVRKTWLVEVCPAYALLKEVLL